MRILHVTAQRPDSTGSGVFLHETVMALREMGYEQAVVAGVGPKDASLFPDNVLFEPVRFETVDLPFPVVGMSDVMPYRATRYRDLTPEMVAQFKAAFNAAFDRVFAEFEPDVILCLSNTMRSTHIASLVMNHMPMKNSSLSMILL